MTFTGILFPIMSHDLPESTSSRLTALVRGVEERLQAEGHKVGSVMAEHPAFDAKYVESPLVRALIGWSARLLAVNGLVLEVLPNGGVTVSHVHDDIERSFRLRRARRDAYGRLLVTVSSDSLLTTRAKDPTLFDDEKGDSFSRGFEQWVLAYEMQPGTRTFLKVSAARVSGLVGEHSPYRLKLADVVCIPHTAPLPPNFKTDKDDLDLPDEEEERGNEAV